jgi:hypothetical protein
MGKQKGGKAVATNVGEKICSIMLGGIVKKRNTKKRTTKKRNTKKRTTKKRTTKK